MRLVPTHVLEAAAQAAPRYLKLKESARQVEAMFLKDLMTTMRKSMGVSVSKGLGGAQYESLFDQAVADELSKSTNLGISQVMLRKMGPRVLGEELELLAGRTRPGKTDKETNIG
ncbi:MAG: rod-binding protein [Fimbriimonadaceae bacterium]|nr:rod-binding protein [Fimbriimonadaceae bacterium]